MARKTVVGTAQVNITADNKGLSKGLNDSRTKIDKFSSNAKKSIASFDKKMSSLTKGFAAFAGVAAVGAAVTSLTRFSRATTDALDKLGKVADKLGISTDQLQQYQFAAEKAGVGQEAFNVGFQRFTRRVEDARNGQGDLLKFFDKFGITLKKANGSFKSSTQLFEEYADAISKTDDSATRLRATFAGFDTEGVALVNLLNRGAAGIRELGEEARETGSIIDKELIREAARLNDELTTLQRKNVAVTASFALQTEKLSIKFKGFVAETLAGWDRILNGVKSNIKIINDFSEASEEGLAKRKVMVSEQLALLAQQHKGNTQIFKDKTQELIALHEEIALRKKLSEQKQLDVAVKDKVEGDKKAKVMAEETRKTNTELERQAEMFRNLADPTKKYFDQLDQIQRLADDGFISDQTFSDAQTNILKMIETQSGFNTQLEETPVLLDEIAIESGKVGEQFQDWIAGSADALTDFILTGKAGFKDFATSVIRDLIRIQIQQALVGLIGTIPTFGAARSGAAAGTPIAGARASGGPISAGKPYLVGEEGPEIITSSTAANVIPNQGLQASPTSVVVNVANSGTPQTVESTDVRQSADGLIVNLVVKDLNSGGPMSQSIGRKFNLTRR